MLDVSNPWKQHGPEHKVLFQARLVGNRCILKPGTVEKPHIAFGRACHYLA